MKNRFNTASLAKLSRQELLALLADLHCQVATAFDETERFAAQSKVEAVKRALAL